MENLFGFRGFFYLYFMAYKQKNGCHEKVPLKMHPAWVAYTERQKTIRKLCAHRKREHPTC
jgi:hypothetical protein